MHGLRKQPRHPRGGAMGRGLALSLLLLLPIRPAQAQADAAGAAAEAGLEEDFGRWERRTQRCELHLQESMGASESLPCQGLRLDQQLAGLMSIRFLPGQEHRSAPPLQLLFAGVLRPGSQPMRCREGRCDPAWPIRLQVSAMAISSLSSLGLPQARVVQGSCSLSHGLATCEAQDREGRRWQARASW